MAEVRATVGRHLGRIHTRLQRAITQRGFTQLEVQETLGWDASYVEQETLRVDHMLEILDVIGVTPEEFFGEIYDFGAFRQDPMITSE